MFYALCHAVDSFLGKDKNAPKKSPAGMACRCFAARLCRPPRFGRYAPSSLRPAQPRKTNSHRIYRTDVALTFKSSHHLIFNFEFQEKKMKFTHLIRAIGLTTMLLVTGVASAAPDVEAQRNEIRQG
jgi:hypothetical protein